MGISKVISSVLLFKSRANTINHNLSSALCDATLTEALSALEESGADTPTENAAEYSDGEDVVCVKLHFDHLKSV